jgi:CDP-glucose 4,6-dehydratase
VGGRRGAVEGLEMNAQFWRGRRVFLTGHTGFKGGWLSLWLHALGAEVSGLALAPRVPGVFDAARVAEVMRSGIGDIRDAAVVSRAMDEARPQVVFHLAAQPLVRASYADPLGTYATNVMGTAHVLDAARRCAQIEAVVVITTDKCYENEESSRPYRESDRLGGRDPYASSKACAELVSSAYARSFFACESDRPRPALATARAGNVIGGGDWQEDRLLPDVVRSLTGGPALLLRNPQAVRPWQHVLEPLHGYLMLAERLSGDEARRFGGAWNFGPDERDARPVGEVTERFLRIWGAPAGWRLERSPGAHESQLLRLDSSKARQSLGWTPVLGLEEALQRTVDWYKRHQAGEDMRRHSLAQIESYARLLANAPNQKGVAA